MRKSDTYKNSCKKSKQEVHSKHAWIPAAQAKQCQDSTRNTNHSEKNKTEVKIKNDAIVKQTYQKELSSGA